MACVRGRSVTRVFALRPWTGGPVCTTSEHRVNYSFRRQDTTSMRGFAGTRGVLLGYERHDVHNVSSPQKHPKAGPLSYPRRACLKTMSGDDERAETVHARLSGGQCKVNISGVADRGVHLSAVPFNLLPTTGSLMSRGERTTTPMVADLECRGNRSFE